MQKMHTSLGCILKFTQTFRKVVTSQNNLTYTLKSCMISNKTNKENKMADENTNAFGKHKQEPIQHIKMYGSCSYFSYK